MDARAIRLALLVPALALLGATVSFGATYSTPNFVVTAPSGEFAKQVADTAERCRAVLAREWLGQALPNWFRPCKVNVTVGQIGAGGATTFTFAAGQVFGWNMNIQGTPERILDSVVPHEVSHTIFASYFRRPLPRWADEGAATLVEHESERRRQQILLKQVFGTPQRIPLRTLISMKEYPSDMQSVLTLYAQAYSLADYLVQSGGKSRYLAFLQDAHDHDWNHAIRGFYGLPDVLSLERRWQSWVVAGSPDLDVPNERLIVQTEAERKRGVIVRSQSPDGMVATGMGNRPARTAQTSEALPQGDSLQAPAPAQRRTLKTRDSDDTRADVSENEQLRRREGRERVLREGWEPIAESNREPAVSTADNENAESDTAPTKPNLARKRFQRAKQQHDADSSSIDKSDPFEDTPVRTADDCDIAEAISPFHAEN